MAKRQIEVAIISDTHLGTHGCQARPLLNYLNSIEPQTLIMNGDIIDIWQFKKKYWPDTHMKVVRKVMKLASSGTKVYYVTGNHDEALRKYSNFSMDNFELIDKLVLDIGDKKAWIFHGDVFDITMRYSKIFAKLGGWGYDILIRMNTFLNWLLALFGQGKISFAAKIKHNMKAAIKFIDDFEQTAAELAIENKYDYVICGHIHQAAMREVATEQGKVLYLNSGDWVESMTALEYNEGKWEIYKYSDGDFEVEEKLKKKKKNKKAQTSLLELINPKVLTN
jgi:UDP-2,3-diacylglucosamine pyrophosphatase LpxH